MAGMAPERLAELPPAGRLAVNRQIALSAGEVDLAAMREPPRCWLVGSVDDRASTLVSTTPRSCSSLADQVCSLACLATGTDHRGQG